MKLEEIKEELKPSTRDIIEAGPVRVPKIDFSYPPLPNLFKLIQD